MTSSWGKHFPGFSSAAELKAWRRAAGWSQAELARHSGVHVQTVKYHEGREGVIGGHAPRRFRAAFETANVLEPRPDGASSTPRTAQLEQADIRCGAKTRKGTPCMAPAIPGSGRCKLHGGKSTGPRTSEGRDRIRRAQVARWERFRAEKMGSASQQM